MNDRHQPAVAGIDLDNTIINFERLFFSVAKKLHYLDNPALDTKNKIRDYIRTLPEGEDKWRKVQAQVYGPEISGAGIYPGFRKFLRKSFDSGITIYIVSHKRKTAAAGVDQTDLRQAASAFLVSSGITGKDRGMLPAGNVFFENSREDKIRRIIKLKCTHFIDDLPETFLHAMFPAAVKQVLFDPHRQYGELKNIQRAGSWNQIYADFFER